jgi:hypothetical protein
MINLLFLLFSVFIYPGSEESVFFFFVLFDVVKCYSVNYRKWNHRGLKGKFIDLFILQWSHVSQMSKT